MASDRRGANPLFLLLGYLTSFTGLQIRGNEELPQDCVNFWEVTVSRFYYFVSVNIVFCDKQ